MWVCSGKHSELVRVHVVKTYAGNRGIAPLILRLGGFTTKKDVEWTVSEAVLAVCRRGKSVVNVSSPRPDSTARCLHSKSTELSLVPLFEKYGTEISFIRQQSHNLNVFVRKSYYDLVQHRYGPG
jgi:hypothetical protein